MSSSSFLSKDEKHSLSIENVDDILRDLEIKFSLFDFRLDNWCIWPILRFPVAMRLLNLPWTQITEEEKLTTIDRINICFSDLLLINLRKADYIILTSSSGQADKNKNKYLDIYFDDLLPHISSYFKIENINNKQYLRNRNDVVYPHQLTTNTPYILAAILAKFAHPKIINSLSNNISKILENEIQLLIPRRNIAKILRTFYWRKRIYNFLLSKLQPHSLLLINAYNNHAVVAAAKEKKIKVIEFQHGVIYTQHPGYSWDKRFLRYKQNMPIPDKIFLYGEFWKTELMESGFWENDLIPTGSLRVDRYRNQRVGKIQSDTCKIIVTTQGLDVSNLSRFLADFLKIIQGNIKVNLSIKLHPREHNTQIYQQVFENSDNVKIIRGASIPSTFDLLVESDLHASISSTCHYEALALGIPTLILPFSSHEKVLHLLNTGYAFKVLTPNQMAECVIKNMHRQVPDSIGDRFFLSNALNHILANLPND